MRQHKKRIWFVWLTVIILSAAGGGGAAIAHEVGEDMAAAANRLLQALTPEQRQKATFGLTAEERRNWHFVPRDRKGLPLKEMTPAQRHLAHGLLSTALSHRGYLKATTIMSLEQVLNEIEQGRGPVRDPELYFFSVFGTPEAHGTWAWRVEGHHLSLNFALADGEPISVTPSFMGSNPAEVREGPRKGLRVLGREQDLGLALVRSLTDAQRQAAIFSTNAPADIVTGTNRVTEMLRPLGLPASKMSDAQRGQLKELLGEYVRRYRPELADQDLKQIGAAGPEQLYFAWAGGLEPGQGSYYRVQGPTFVMEYDNTQNNANHIHTVWRDFKGEFGEDPLRRHYQETPHPH